MKIIYTILSILLIYLIFILHKNYLFEYINFYKYLFIGIAVYIVSIFTIKPSKDNFAGTFFHELSHTVFAVLTLARVKKFTVSPQNPINGAKGSVSYHHKPSKIFANTREYLISLAPYFFSPLAFVFFMIYWVISPTNGFMIEGISTSQTTINIVLFFCGFFYAYNLRTSFIQTGEHQSDFNAMGYKKGLVFVIFMQLVFLLFYSLILFSNHDSFLFLYDFIVDNFNSFDYDDIVFDIRMFLYDNFDIWL